MILSIFGWNSGSFGRVGACGTSCCNCWLLWGRCDAVVFDRCTPEKPSSGFVFFRRNPFAITEDQEAPTMSRTAATKNRKTVLGRGLFQRRSSRGKESCKSGTLVVVGSWSQKNSSGAHGPPNRIRQVEQVNAAKTRTRHLQQMTRTQVTSRTTLNFRQASISRTIMW